MCDCRAKLSTNNSHNFNHYDPKNDVLGSNFDDFGTMTYAEPNGTIHTFVGHRQLGMYGSFQHPITDQKIPEDWKITEFKIDNSVIPKICTALSQNTRSD